MNIVLKGRDCYSQLQVLAERLMDNSSTNPRPYWRATYGGKAFIVREDFKNAWDKAELAEVTITPKTYPVIDDEGNSHDVEGFSITGSLTYQQAKSITRNEAELTAITKKVVEDFQLDPADLA